MWGLMIYARCTYLVILDAQTIFFYAFNAIGFQLAMLKTEKATTIIAFFTKYNRNVMMVTKVRQQSSMSLGFCSDFHTNPIAIQPTVRKLLT